MASISFPFRVPPLSRDTPTGEYVPRAVVTNVDGADAEVDEAIALHILTETLERPLRPEFGTVSLPFGDGLSQGGLQLQLLEHGWEHIFIADVATGEPEGNRVESAVFWERRA